MSSTVKSDIESRVGALEDVAAIATAMGRFLREIDMYLGGSYQGGEPGAVPASTEIEIGAPFAGTWTLGDLLRRASEVSFSLCFIGSEQIDLSSSSSDEAIGRWVSWQPLTIAGQAWLIAGRFANHFYKDEGVWRLGRIRFDPEIVAPWTDGWSPTIGTPSTPAFFDA